MDDALEGNVAAHDRVGKEKTQRGAANGGQHAHLDRPDENLPVLDERTVGLT